MNKVAEWQIKNLRHAQNDWTNGAFYAGMYAIWETTKSKMIYDAMMAMGNDSTQWRPHRRWEDLFARDLNYVIKGDSTDRWEANGQRIF